MKYFYNVSLNAAFIAISTILFTIALIIVLPTSNPLHATSVYGANGTPDPASGHTFSIVAVDPETGAIGSAGASCIDGSSRISVIVIGRGAIHAQALLNLANRDNATQRMLLGDSPQEIIDWLQINDVQNDPQQRQYGIVDFDENGEPRSVGFTGTDTFAFQNHITGTTYAIQGNILSGQTILDRMEENFNSTEGSLAERLMESLQGANVAGADTRCLRFGTSSLSAFIRVACPDDRANDLHLDIDINRVRSGVEPLDLLQTQFDSWLASVPNSSCTPDPLSPTPTIMLTETPTETPIETPAPTATPTTIGILGDTSCNGAVDAVDALFIVRYNVGLVEGVPSCLEGSTAISLDACDVNDSGTCNAVDALLILQCHLGLKNTFCN